MWILINTLICVLAGWLALALPNIAAAPEPDTTTSTSKNISVNAPSNTKAPSPLKAAVVEFQNNRCNATWANLAQAFKTYLSTNPAPSSGELKTLGLTELGIACIQQPTLKLWYFPKVVEDRGLYLQWTEPPVTRSSKSRHKGSLAVHAGTTSPQPQVRVQFLPLPNGTVLKDARLLVLARHNESHHPATPVVKKKTGSHNLTVHRLAASSSRFLILAGLQQQGNILWIDCYQLSGGVWKQDTAPLSKISPFLLGRLTGDIAFAGNDLVLTASPLGEQAPSSTVSASPSKGKSPDLSVYKLSLRLVDNYYLLDGQGHTDTACNTVTQFLQAEQEGRADLAKGWLEEPSAASIPKYIQLFNQGSLLSHFRLISLSSPRSVYRYRLITFGKDDLIFDVTHPKDQWIIKAIFVAPSDVGWQKIGQSLPPIM